MDNRDHIPPNALEIRAKQLVKELDEEARNHVDLLPRVKRPRLDSVDQIVNQLRLVYSLTLHGKMSPEQCNACCKALKIVADLRTDADAAKRISYIEEKITKLTEELMAKKQPTKELVPA